MTEFGHYIVNTRMMDDTGLLRAYAKNRSEEAFAGFVGRRIGFVHGAALRLVGGDAHMAHDVTQAVFALVAAKAGMLAGHGRLAGWLYTTTCNVSRQAMRDARRRNAREQEAIRMSAIERESGRGETRAAEMGVAETDAAAILRPLLDEALGGLREGEREAVLLRYFEGRAFAEIGAKLKMSEDAARKRVERAVEKMRGAFAKRGVTSGAAALGAMMTAEAAQAAPMGLAASVSAGALATAATGTGAATVAGAGVFLAFMSSAKITIAAIVALLLAAGGFYYGAQSDRASSDALARARHENVELAAQLRELEKQNAASVAPSVSASREERIAAGEAFVDAHPELKEKMRAWTNAVGARYSFRIAYELNLSPGQSARLAEIIRGPVTSFGDIVPGYGEVLLRFGNWQPRSKREQEMRDLLGGAGYEKFGELLALENAGADYNIIELSNALYFTDDPLTPEQARSLEKIAIDLEKNHAGITDSQARWRAFMEQAGSTLSPAQMHALTSVGDRYVWKHTSQKWRHDYDKTRTVTIPKPVEK